MNRIYALVGMCGAGKSVVCDYFKEKGWEYVYFGGVTMDELKRRGLEKNEANERAVREELRRVHGPAAFAKLLLPTIREKLETGDVVLDGLYSWSEYKVLKEAFADTLEVIAIVADRKIRYERIKKRVIRPLDEEGAKSRDYAEIEKLEKGGPIAMADYFVFNNGSVEETVAQIERIVG